MAPPYLSDPRLTALFYLFRRRHEYAATVSGV